MVLAPLFAIALVAFKIYYSLYLWHYSGPDVEFVVSPGESFAQINSHLIKEKLISNGRIFHRYAQYNGLMNKIKTGTYVIKSQSTTFDVINILFYGKGEIAQFTVPEGKNIFEIGKMLEERGITTYSEFVKTAKDRSYLREIGIDAETAEGYLYPNTYAFSGKLPPKFIIKTMHDEFEKKMKSIDFGQSSMSFEDVITLASVVEKETGKKSERPMIAGVFLNRLKMGMRLQSDPTTIYGIFENYQGNLTKNDLLTETPYNTYKIKALPKGPICNPGEEAIKAVLNPAQHKYLFFVSQNDGSHVFTENYEDHQKAVNTWQKNASNREGKSWRDLKQD